MTQFYSTSHKVNSKSNSEKFSDIKIYKISESNQYITLVVDSIPGIVSSIEKLYSQKGLIRDNLFEIQNIEKNRKRFLVLRYRVRKNEKI